MGILSYLTDRRKLMGTSKVVIAKGLFTHEGDMEVFFDALRISGLGKDHHHVEPPKIVKDGCRFRVTLRIEDHSWFLVRASLKDGMLRYWGKQFTIEEVVR